MNNSISYCGLVCSGCPIYMVSREQNNARKKKMFREIIRQAKEEYNISLTAGDINHCDGCMSDTGRLFSGCINCTIRKCNKSKGLENCGYCDKYPCEKLDEIFKSDPAAKTRLDFIHAVI